MSSESYNLRKANLAAVSRGMFYAQATTVALCYDLSGGASERLKTIAFAICGLLLVSFLLKEDKARFPGKSTSLLKGLSYLSFMAYANYVFHWHSIFQVDKNTSVTILLASAIICFASLLGMMIIFTNRLFSIRRERLAREALKGAE